MTWSCGHLTSPVCYILLTFTKNLPEKSAKRPDITCQATIDLGNTKQILINLMHKTTTKTSIDLRDRERE